MPKKESNHLEQVQAMAKLAQPWQPTELAGFRIGDCVRLPGIAAPLRVVRLADPLLVLQSPAGHELRAGWRAVSRIRTRAEIGGPANEK